MTEQSPPKNEPYQAPQVQPYGTPAVQPTPANQAPQAVQPPQSQQSWNPDEIPWRRRQAGRGGPPVGQFNDQVARTSPGCVVAFVAAAVVVAFAIVAFEVILTQ